MSGPAGPASPGRRGGGKVTARRTDGDRGPSEPGGSARRRRHRPGSRAARPTAVGFCGRPRRRAGGTVGPAATPPRSGRARSARREHFCPFVGEARAVGEFDFTFGGGVRNAARQARDAARARGTRAEGVLWAAARGLPGDSPKELKFARAAWRGAAGQRGRRLTAAYASLANLRRPERRLPQPRGGPADSTNAAELVPELPAAPRTPRLRSAGTHHGPEISQEFGGFHVEPGKGDWSPGSWNIMEEQKTGNISVIKGN